jgi:hypothetical protein
MGWILVTTPLTNFVKKELSKIRNNRSKATVKCGKAVEIQKESKRIVKELTSSNLPSFDRSIFLSSLL